MTQAVIDRTAPPRYQGKAKRLYETDDPGQLLVEYTDSATAFNGEKRAEIGGKGQLNNEISARFLTLLGEGGVPNHFIRLVSPTEQLVRAVEIVPLEVIVRNIAAGSLAKRLGLEEGLVLPHPIVEFSYKRDDLGDPLVTRAHISALGLADRATLDTMEAFALRVNELLREHLTPRGVMLVDFKLEFGHTQDGELILADEVSPDTCRFWDTATGEKLDKDRFRRDLGGVEAAYTELLKRLVGDAGEQQDARA